MELLVNVVVNGLKSRWSTVDDENSQTAVVRVVES